MPDEEKKPDTVQCPCCGQPTLKKPIKVDGKIVDDYLASIMTGVPFNHTFSLFDGKLKITTSMLDRDEGLQVFKFINLVEPFSSESTHVQDLLGLVNTYCSISRIEITAKDGKLTKAYYPAKHIVEGCVRLLEDWELEDLQDTDKKKAFFDAVIKAYTKMKATENLSSTPPRVLNQVNNDFRALEAIMLQAGFDENFWKGIELG